jgi:hypothetical protein
MEDVRQGVAEENEMNASEEATSTRVTTAFLRRFESDIKVGSLPKEHRDRYEGILRASNALVLQTAQM